jgi:rifampin ADP-ribosylating transferase
MSHDETGSPPYYHGTRADLRVGDHITLGHLSNYGSRRTASFVYFSATLDAAIWGAELALGPGRERIYIVEPTGAFEDDPNLTDKKFPGNPTRSYRTRASPEKWRPGKGMRRKRSRRCAITSRR